MITHKVEEQNGVAYIDNVPAKVCNLCGDTILAAEVMQTIHRIINGAVEQNG